MLGKIKAKLTEVFLGDLVKDWGVVSHWEGRFFTEELSLALYTKDGQNTLCLTYKQKSSISSNTFLFSFPVGDLGVFVKTLQQRWAEFERAAASPRTPPTAGPNKIPWVHRLMLRAIHGVRLSRLLLDHEDPASGDFELRMYGYITRSGETRVFMQTDIDVSQNKGHVVSGGGVQSVIRVLEAYVEEDGRTAAG